MTVRYKGGGGGGGVIEVPIPNPTDSFSIRINTSDTVSTATDNLSVAFTFPETVQLPTDAVSFTLVFPDSVNDATDALTSLNIRIAETVPVPSDAASFLINYSVNDIANSPTDAVTFRLTFPDSVDAPTDTKTAQVRFWGQNAAAVNSTGGALSGTASTNMAPGNANGSNNGTVAQVRTAIGGVLDTTNPVCLLTSQFGATTLLFPPNITAQRLRVWFNIPEGTIGTDTVQIQYRTDGVTNSDAGWTNLFTWAPTPAVDYMTNPHETVVSFTQTQADNLVMRVRYQAAVTATPDSRVELDAWCLEVDTTL